MLNKLNKFFQKIKKSNTKKKTLYLHVGMGKTGTTALQEFFWENRNILLKNFGIAYPEYGSVSCAHHLLSPHIPSFLAVDWKFLQPEEWCPNLATNDADKILVSSELIAWASPEMISDFCAEIAKWFNVKVVIYLRRQDNLIMAGYNQQIKAGTQKRHINDVIEKQFERFDYAKKLQPWIDAWGEENIIVRPFERQQFFQGDIRYDFLYRVFGIDSFELFGIQDDGGNPNPRLSFKAMEYKRWINNIISNPAISSQFNKALLDYSAATDDSSTKVFSTKALLSPDKRKEILDKCEPINSEIARKFLKREDGRLFFDPEPVLDEWNDYISISHAEKAEITAYIRKNHPKLYDLLNEYSDKTDLVQLGKSQVLKTTKKTAKKKLIVHMGVHKTGSSAIQEALYNLDLTHSEYDYLHFGRANSSLVIGNAFRNDENLSKRYCTSDMKKLGRIRQHARTLIIDTLNSSEKANLILSAEVISAFCPDEIHDLISFLREYFQNITFFVYIREPVSYSVSAFQEKIKRNYIAVEPYSLEFDSVIDTIEKLIGRDNVHTYLYNKNDFPDGNIVRHFFEKILNNESGVYKIESSERNESLSLTSVKFLYIYRKLLVSSDVSLGCPNTFNLFMELMCFQGEKLFFHSDLAKQVVKKNTDFYKWAMEKTGKAFSPYSPPLGVASISGEDDLMRVSFDELQMLNTVLKHRGIAVCDKIDVMEIAQKIHMLRLSVIE